MENQTILTNMLNLINSFEFNFWHNQKYIILTLISESIQENVNLSKKELELIAVNLERIKEEDIKNNSLLENEIIKFNQICDILNRLSGKVIIEKING